jgi:hypothetical protein
MRGKMQNWTGIIKPSASRFNIHKFYVLPTQCIYVFYTDLRSNSDYFPVLLAYYLV